MQIERLYQYFESSGRVNSNSIAELEQVVAETPYFQLAWMLYAKAKNDNDKSDYNKTLSQAAARVFDREQLFDFIYNQQQAKAEIAKPPVVIAKKEPVLPKVDTTPKPRLEKKENDKNVIKSAHIPKKPAPIRKENGEVLKSKEELQAVVKARLAAIEQDKKTVKKKVIVKDKEKENPKSVKSNMDIIESFIKQNPVINKPKDAEYKEELEVAKKSLDDHLDFVSETLAEINLKQGHVKKALKIYEKLSLKYPEKSSYFAAQIKKIKPSK